MARRDAPATRVQVYINDPKVVASLNREARAGRIALSQAAGQAIVRGLVKSPRADPDDRLLNLERSLRDHMRSTGRDMQIVQELLIEVVILTIHLCQMRHAIQLSRVQTTSIRAGVFRVDFLYQFL